MAENTLYSSIETLVISLLNEIPKSMEGVVTKAYPNDSTHVDIKLNGDGSVLKYIKLFGENTVNSDCVVVFIDGNINNPVAITSNSDSKWIELTKSSDFIDYDDSSKVKYRKYGKLVDVNGICQLDTSLSSSDSVVLGQLPEGFRPSRNQVFLCEMFNSPYLWRCTVNTDGELIVSDIRDGGGVVSVNGGQVLNVNIKFLVD